VVLYTFTRNIIPIPSFLSKLPWSKSKFNRLSGGTPTVPIFTRDSSYLEKTESRDSRTTTLSPTNSRPGTAQSIQQPANPFSDATVTAFVPAYQRDSNGQMRTVSLVKTNSISSINSMGSRKGFVGLSKNGRTVIKKPQPATLNPDPFVNNAGLERGRVQRSMSVEV